MTALDQTQELAEQVSEARAKAQPLRIVGGNTKPWLGRPVEGTTLDLSNHRGITSFEPTELVLTARAGTPLSEIESALADANQILPFEPPHFGPGATLGGTIACGLSGPRRPFAGSARDLVLGTRVISGRGEALRFGGEVIKNVAGYDVSRLMVGAYGTLGVLLEASVKVLPAPQTEVTITLEHSVPEAIAAMDALGGKPYPLSAMAHVDGVTRVRLSGTQAGVASAVAEIGGETDEQGCAWWHSIREHTHAFFSGDRPLWRVSVPAATPPIILNGECLLDWAGTQRWVRTGADAATVRAAAAEHGGHATCYRGNRAASFHSLSPALEGVHKRLKTAFDPDRILNPGRIYPHI